MTAPGLVVRESDSSYAATLARLNAALAQRGIEPMARIDHGRLAEGVGLDLGPMMLLMFGNPAAGTQLMQVAPGIGIDLPLKLLIWEAQGKVSVAFNDPQWLAQRHGISEPLPVLEAMRALLEALADAAARGSAPC